ncbi:MAG: hypothetical protein KU37_02840 [Sulfuricurvum sp. PC08-66]|nr:MAG: hypothetical protein KU37_02840 [Sulfuricurvum sp. PC08-66]
MKIGLLSDTHKRVKRTQKALDHLVAQGVESIIHAGDIVREEILELIVATQLPYTIVLGNNDEHLKTVQKRYGLVNEPHHFKLYDKEVTLMHHPVNKYFQGDIVIYGHTHTFDARMLGNTLILNPGETCARNKPLSECAMLEITPTHYRIVYYHRTLKTPTWHAKEYLFSHKALPL